MKSLYQFFLKNEIRSKRIVWLSILSMVPPLVACALWLVRPMLENEGIELYTLYPNVSLLIYLHFLLPLVAVLAGTAVISEEVRDRTLPYLITRPNPRWQIVLAKMAAMLTVLLPLFLVSISLTYSCFNLSGGFGHWVTEMPKLFSSYGILVLGLLVYLPLFTFMGGLIRKSVILGLFFAFGWEAQVSLLPGNIKLLTIAHYLHVLYPEMASGKLGGASSQLMSFLIKTKETSILTSWMVLIVCCALFIFLASTLLYWKEYAMSQDD